jgi:hypothetical protein
MCVIIFIIPGCGISDSEVDERTICTVICDISNSTTLIESNALSDRKGQLDKVKSIATMLPLLECYILGSEFHYFPVSNSLVEEELASISIDLVSKSKLADIMKKYSQDSLNLCAVLDDKSSVSGQSCIINSVERSIRKHFEIDDSIANREIILISDMLEYCDYSSGDNIKLSFKNPARLATELEKLAMLQTRYDERLAKVNVRVYVVSPWAGDMWEELEDEWEDYFVRRGFSLDKVDFFLSPPSKEDIDYSLFN